MANFDVSAELSACIAKGGDVVIVAKEVDELASAGVAHAMEALNSASEEGAIVLFIANNSKRAEKIEAEFKAAGAPAISRVTSSFAACEITDESEAADKLVIVATPNYVKVCSTRIEDFKERVQVVLVADVHDIHDTGFGSNLTESLDACSGLRTILFTSSSAGRNGERLTQTIESNLVNHVLSKKRGRVAGSAAADDVVVVDASAPPAAASAAFSLATEFEAVAAGGNDGMIVGDIDELTAAGASFLVAAINASDEEGAIAMFIAGSSKHAEGVEKILKDAGAPAVYRVSSSFAACEVSDECEKVDKIILIATANHTKTIADRVEDFSDRLVAVVAGDVYNLHETGNGKDLDAGLKATAGKQRVLIASSTAGRKAAQIANSMEEFLINPRLSKKRARLTK